MSRGSRNSRQPENWQPGQEYWVYVPNNRNLNGSMPLPSGFPLALGSLSVRGRTTDPWSLFEERLFPPTASSRPQIRPLLIDDYDTYPRSRNSMYGTPTHNYDPTRYDNRIPEHEGSKLSGEEQKRAISRLRKQLHSPHLSNIIKRLGTSNNSTTSGSGSSQPDDDWKRCAVCLEDFDTKQFLMLTPCNHMFHEECIVPWVKSQGKCPVCRFVIAEKNAPPPLGQGTIEWSQFFQPF